VDELDIGIIKTEIQIIMDETIQAPTVFTQHGSGGWFHAGTPFPLIESSCWM
jgi:hypothetical protein